MNINTLTNSKDRVLLNITAAVLLAHLFFLFFTAYLPESKPIVKPQEKKLTVQTVTLDPKPQRVAARREIIPETVIEPIQEMISEPEPSLPALSELAPQLEVIPEPAPMPMESLPEVPKPVAEPELPNPVPKVDKPKTKPIPKKVEPKKKTETVKKPAAKPDAKPAAKAPKKETKKAEPKTNKSAKPAQPKPKEVKKETAAKVVAKPDPVAEAAKAKRRELIANAQKNIAKIGQNHDTLSSSKAVAMATIALPESIGSLQVETFAKESGQSLTFQEITYYDELASRLKLLLRLPDYGEVKIKLTLDRSGRFVKVTILNSESKDNRKYIEKTLPTLKYPSFGNNFSEKSEYTFVIALSNDL